MYSEGAAGEWVGAFKGGGGERRGGGVGRLIEGGGVGRPTGKNLQILDHHRLASLRSIALAYKARKTLYYMNNKDKILTRS